jgi:hypothetical protein
MFTLSRLAAATKSLATALAAATKRHRHAVTLVVLAGLQAAYPAPLSGGPYVEADGWRARFTIDCLLKDKVCGKFRYETLACEGDLIYSGETPTGFEFRAQLRAGRCLPGCTIQVSSDFKHYAEVCRDSRHEGSLAPGDVPTTAGFRSAAAAPAASRAIPSPRAASEPAGASGQGHVKWDNGDVFDGQLLDGKRNGRGRMVWASGQSYEGEWRDDAADGQGTMIFANGDRYAGQVKDGIPQGRGKMHFANGDSFEGQFDRGTPDVEGVYVQKDGSRYEGQWKAGLKNGRGKLVWAGGQSYEGDWVADKPEGMGHMTFANGDRYDGPVSKGLPQGKGVKVFASQDRYEGDFEQGQAQGQGVLRWKNGDVYAGAWEKGKKVGKGRYQWANGDYWEGEFADDNRTDAGRLYFTPKVTASSVDGSKVAVAADALTGPVGANASGSRGAKPGDSAVDRTRLLAIPMVAKELRACSKKQGGDCANRVVDDVLNDRLQEHKWQTMASEKGATGKASVFEVDANSVLEGGNVFSWLRSGDGTQARNVGIKYDCRGQSLEIQLIYHCTGAQGCVLDPNIDKYAGKVLPATDIKGWFKEACER